MTVEVALTPIRKGYGYQVDISLPEDFLADGETMRADLRQTVTQQQPSASFEVERSGDNVSLTLSADDTADLPARRHLMDLTLVLTGDVEVPVLDQRFIIPVEEHVTRASA
jgi:hypothetical protein